MSNGRVIFGIILIAVGGIFFLDKFHIFKYVYFHDFWPIILIIVGVALIIRHNKRKVKEPTDNYHQFQSSPGHKKYSTVFGDNNFGFKDAEVDGLNCSTVFGDSTINLADAKLKPGTNRIDISGVFGDLTVIIPASMEVSAFGSCTFGDLYILGKSASGISNTLQNQTEGYDTASAKLSIWASITFGDIKIYRA
ncbi:MAG: cell wall-active antibiotics response protein LiaF [Candidatus Zixiibacteriota bacterium]